MTRNKLKDRLRILLVRDHNRQDGYDTLLEQEGKFTIVGKALNPNKAVEMADKYLPDIGLIDSTTSPAKGIETIKRLRKSHPQLTIIVLSYPTEEQFIAEALQA